MTEQVEVKPNLSVAIAGGGDQSKRRELDFYPTPPEVTVALMEFLRSTLRRKVKTVWEPACGDGAMSKVIESYGLDVFSTDLREGSGYGAGGLDFLAHHNIGADMIITNPPFNKAEEFIRKAVSYSPVVAMVLKSQYWHAKKRVDLFNECPPSYILPLTWRPDFLGGGNPTMDCMWVVWIEGDKETKYKPLLKC